MTERSPEKSALKSVTPKERIIRRFNPKPYARLTMAIGVPCQIKLDWLYTEEVVKR